MDWMSGFSQYNAQPDVEDDDEDFYNPQDNSVSANGDTQAVAGAPPGDQNTFGVGQNAALQPASVPQTPTVESKASKQAHIDALRAKLIAKRVGGSRPDTPSKASMNIKTLPPATQKMEEQQQSVDEINSTPAEAEQPSSDVFGSIEALLAESKAAADAKTARDNQAIAAATVNGSAKNQAPASIEPDNIQQKEQKLQEETSIVTRANRPPQAHPKPNAQRKSTDTSTNKTNTQPTKLSDPYYDDLPVWLQYTGYHDVEFRNSKLSNFRERRKLEQEAARIAEALEKLKQAEKADLESLRATTAHPAAAGMAPPPLPANMPTGELRPTTNGIKRPRSPEPPTSEKASRRAVDPGFRIRGADEASGPPPRNPVSPPDRRVSFPERRRSIDDSRDRDLSLERRKRHYKRQDDAGPGQYETWTPQRDPPRLLHRNDEREDRPGFNSLPRGIRYNGASSYRGSSGLDLRKGGVRYFMIKSWNHENVQASMADGLWATQEKNEQPLTEAFNTSRHVILLFSVNRSMAFQGSLNWGTSPAFTVQWLATTPVHFKMVGHLKNTCNPGDDGVPRAVLVGKDGQEISQEAGRGVCGILDEEEAFEGGFSGGEG